MCYWFLKPRLRFLYSLILCVLSSCVFSVNCNLLQEETSLMHVDPCTHYECSNMLLGVGLIISPFSKIIVTSSLEPMTYLNNGTWACQGYLLLSPFPGIQTTSIRRCLVSTTTLVSLLCQRTYFSKPGFILGHKEHTWVKLMITSFCIAPGN